MYCIYNITGLIHQQSDPNLPALVVPAYTIAKDPTILFGGIGKQGGIDGTGRGVLSYVGGRKGFSLVIRDVDTLPPTLLAGLQDLVMTGMI